MLETILKTRFAISREHMSAAARANVSLKTDLFCVIVHNQGVDLAVIKPCREWANEASVGLVCLVASGHYSVEPGENVMDISRKYEHYGEYVQLHVSRLMPRLIRLP